MGRQIGATLVTGLCLLAVILAGYGLGRNDSAEMCRHETGVACLFAAGLALGAILRDRRPGDDYPIERIAGFAVLGFIVFATGTHAFSKVYDTRTFIESISLLVLLICGAVVLFRRECRLAGADCSVTLFACMIALGYTTDHYGSGVFLMGSWTE